ncbi:MAG: hypothetical protein AABY06_01635 [Nanoarchaeota archaeon]
MINHKEILTIIGVSIIIAFSITLLSSFSAFLIALLSVFAVIIINVFAKKLTGEFFELKTEIKLWEFKRWGYKHNQSFKKNIPAGAIFPILSRIIFFPLKGFVWMAPLVFDVRAKIYRTAKRHGIYSFSDVSEDHLAYIAGAGILINLLAAALGYLIGFSEFAKFNIWFAFFNLIPLSNLDGNKIFFGNKVLWSFLATITLIALGYSFLVV